MRYLFMVLCLFSLYGSVKPKDISAKSEEVKESGIVMLLDNEEIKAEYTHLPTMEVHVEEENYDALLQVFYFDAKQMAFTEIKANWKLVEKEGKAREYVFQWQFMQEMEDTYIVLKQKDVTRMKSRSFSIRAPLLKPAFYVDGEQLSKDSYVFAKQKQVELHFPCIMKPEETSITWMGKQQELHWNKQKDKASFMINQEGEGSLYYEIKDIQDHELKGESSFSIQMDFTAPKVNLLVNGQPWKEHRKECYAQDVHIYIEIWDKSFDSSKSNIYINQKEKEVEWVKEAESFTTEFILKDGEYEIAYEIKDKLEHVHDGKTETIYPKWVHKGNALQCDYKWNEEGNYAVYVVASDAMKHTATSEKQMFTIDKTPPAISLKLNHKLQEKGGNYLTNRNVLVDAIVTDTTLSKKQLALYKNGELVFEKANWQPFEILAEQRHNDAYEVRLYGEDQAHNSKEQRFSFRITTLMDAIEIANDIFHGLPSSKDWKPQIKNKDYHVVQTVLRKNHEIQDFHWGDTIRKEGRYTLEIMAEDKAGNRRWLQPSFSFEIDKTPPQARLVLNDLKKEVKNKVKISKRFLLMIEPYDLNLQKQGRFAYVRINGLEVSFSEAKYVPLCFHKQGNYLIEAGVIDEAGNKADYKWNVQVIEDEVKYEKAQKPIQFKKTNVIEKANKMQFIPIFIGISCVACVVIGYFYYVRKRQN